MPFGFSAGPVQIATCNFPPRSCDLFTLPPHAPCRLQHGWTIKLTTTLLLCLHTPRADCNNVPECKRLSDKRLCLHTPRADCNKRAMRTICATPPLPPHAPCRLQLRRLQAAGGNGKLCLHTPRADCNALHNVAVGFSHLCLHTPRADCNGKIKPPAYYDTPLCLHTPRADCNCRNAQNCNMHFSERVLSW